MHTTEPSTASTPLPKHTERMQTDARKVLNFLVSRRKGSEDSPVRYGNVEFWHPIPGFAAALCYSIPVAQWDTTSVQNDINADASLCWDELVAHLKD